MRKTTWNMSVPLELVLRTSAVGTVADAMRSGQTIRTSLTL